MENSKLPLYQTTWFTVLMLCFVFPVGLFLMWKYNKFNLHRRRIISAVIGILFLFSLIFKGADKGLFLLIIGILLIFAAIVLVVYFLDKKNKEKALKSLILVPIAIVLMIHANIILKFNQVFNSNAKIAQSTQVETSTEKTTQKLITLNNPYQEELEKSIIPNTFSNNTTESQITTEQTTELETIVINETEPQIQAQEQPQTPAPPVEEPVKPVPIENKVETPVPVDNNSETVYVGDTGNKYHYASCRTLKGGGRAITLQQAISQGRTGCKVCDR